MTTMLEKMAKAIGGAEIGYSIRLTRLVDDEATYTLIIDGKEPREFASQEEALAVVVWRKRTTAARAAIEALRGAARHPGAAWQAGYDAVCDTGRSPNPEEHWEGYVTPIMFDAILDAILQEGEGT